MVKTKLKDVKEQIIRQYGDVYGDTSVSGSMTDPGSDDDVDEMLDETLGKDASEEAEGHDTQTIAEEVNEDEEALHTKPEDQEEEE